MNRSLINCFVLVCSLGACSDTSPPVGSNNDAAIPPADDSGVSNDVATTIDSSTAVDAGPDTSTSGCTDADINAHTAALTPADVVVTNARFSADGKSIFFTFWDQNNASSSNKQWGIRRVDPCGKKTDDIFTDSVASAFAVDQNDVGYFVDGSGFVSAPMTPATTPAVIEANAYYENAVLLAEVGETSSIQYLSNGWASANVLREEGGQTTDVTATILGAGRKLAEVNGMPRGFRVSPDRKKAAALVDPTGSESGPQVIIYDFAAATQLHLAVQDANPNPGQRQPSGLAWMSDSTHLLVVNFDNVIEVDSTVATLQVSPVIGTATTDASIFDLASGDKRFLYVENNALYARALQ